MRIDVATSEDMESVFRLRYEVYTLDQGLDPLIDVDERDAMAIHLMARNDDGECVGTARLFEDEGRWFLGRMAVARSGRRSGIGRQLVCALEQIAAERGAQSIELHAQVQAIGFYAKLGYEPFGGEDTGAGIPHRWMRKSLAVTK